MSTALSRHFKLLADYNRWANHVLYEACGQLSDAEFCGPRQAFFGSIMGTLNHILVGDQAWLSRLRGDPPPGVALDHLVFDALPELAEARLREDAKIAAYVSALTEAEFSATVSYKNMSGVAFENTASHVLAHMFNHQTHHRGQEHDMLSQTDVPPPKLDLIFYIRQSETS